MAGVCGILGKLTLLFALTLKAPESQHGLYRGFCLQKGTNYGDLKAWQRGMHSKTGWLDFRSVECVQSLIWLVSPLLSNQKTTTKGQTLAPFVAGFHTPTQIEWYRQTSTERQVAFKMIPMQTWGVSLFNRGLSLSINLPVSQTERPLPADRKSYL